MKEYFKFDGVAKRQEYWAILIVSIILTIIGLVLVEGGSAVAALIALVLLIGTLWVLIATTVRRLRDAGLNAWWVILIFVPYVSFVVHIVFGCIGTKKEE